MTDNAAPEHLPDCPVDGAYGCPGTCPCQCHNPPTAIPDEVRLSDEQFEACRPDISWQWSSDDFAWSIARLAEDNLWANTRAEVAELDEEIDIWGRKNEELGIANVQLQEQLGAAKLERNSAMELVRVYIEERDAALERERALVEAGRKWLAMDYGNGLHVDGCGHGNAPPDFSCTCGLEDMQAAIAASKENLLG